jgi:hypothetical protein
VAPFFAASCKNFPSTLGFHALAKPVLFMAAPHMRLKSAFRQRFSPSQFIAARALLRIAGPVETSSLDDLRATVKEPPLALESFWRRKKPRLAVRTGSPSPSLFLYLSSTFPVPFAHPGFCYRKFWRPAIRSQTWRNSYRCERAASFCMVRTACHRGMFRESLAAVLLPIRLLDSPSW